MKINNLKKYTGNTCDMHIKYKENNNSSGNCVFDEIIANDNGKNFRFRLFLGENK